MDLKFKSVRAYIAGLVGNPNLSEKMALDMEQAISADESAIKELMTKSDALPTTQAVATPTTTPPAPTEQTPTPTATVATSEPVTLESLMATINAVQTQLAGVVAENTQLKKDNKELTEFRAAQSPRNVAIQSENTGAAGKTRVSKSAEKDAAHVAELTRLTEEYPELMEGLM